MATSTVNVDNNCIRSVVRKDEALLLIDMFKTDEFIQAAYNMLDTHLFLTGLTILKTKKSSSDSVTKETYVYKEDEETKNNEDSKDNNKSPAKKSEKESTKETNTKKSYLKRVFEFAIKNDFDEFLRSVLADLISLGYTLVCLEEDIFKIGETPVIMPTPTVVPRLEYDIEIVTSKSNYKPNYDIIMNHSNHRNPKNCFLFLMPGKKPDPITGEHQSIISPLKRIMRKVRVFEAYYMMAIQKRANPHIFFEELPGGSEERTSSIKSVHFDYENRKLVEVKAPIGSDKFVPVKRRKIDDSLLREYISDSSKIVFPDSLESRLEYIDSGYKLPSGGAPLPEPPMEFLQMNDQLRAHVFAIMQLPETMLYSQISSKYGTSTHVDLGDADSQKLNRTLRIYKNALLKLVKQIYIEIFDDDNDVEFDLPIFNPMSMYTATLLEDLDYISKDDAQRMVYQAAGLPEHNLFTGQNLHLRPRIGGNENMTAPMIKSRTNNINADTDLKKADIKKSSSEIDKLDAEAISIKKGDNKKN